MSAPRPGFIHPAAWIDSPPEHRDWLEGTPLLASEIDPTAQINAFVTVDSGFWNPTRIGARTFVMAHCHIAHDCQIGDDCELAAGAILAGHVILGNEVRVGVNACFRPFVTVGDGARIGAGAVVVSNVPAGEVWAGNPARRLEPRAVSEDMTETEREGWEEWWNGRTTKAEAEARLGQAVRDPQGPASTARCS